MIPPDPGKALRDALNAQFARISNYSDETDARHLLILIADYIAECHCDSARLSALDDLLRIVVKDREIAEEKDRREVPETE